MPQLTSGIVAPDFDLLDTTGNRFHLKTALEIGPVVLVFSKASCPTCQFTFPYIARLHRDSGSESLTRIVGISQDDPDETKEFMQQGGIAFPMLLDEHPYAVSSAYGLEFVPAVFIVMPDRVILESDYGFSKTALDAVAEVIARNSKLSGIEPVRLFPPGDRLPLRRPGCRSKN